MPIRVVGLAPLLVFSKLTNAIMHTVNSSYNVYKYLTVVLLLKMGLVNESVKVARAINGLQQS